MEINLIQLSGRDGLSGKAKGINLRKSYMPCGHFWLINTDITILGVIRVRHSIKNEFLSLEAGHIGYDIVLSHLGKLMLKLVLPKAKQLEVNCQ